MDRMAEVKKKTGVFTDFYAINDLTGKKMPIWISDFVLIGFGTGAVVGVPGHDLRDFEFAKEFGIEIIRVVVGKNGDKSLITELKQVQEEEGTMINSGFLDGLDIHEATKKIMDYMVEKSYGKKTVSYHIHDWSISRQRYWGTPVPVIHCPDDGIIPVSEKNLPIELPYEVDFTPHGKPPLATNEKWLNVKCPKCGKNAKRDAETLDTFLIRPGIGLDIWIQNLKKDPSIRKSKKINTGRRLFWRVGAQFRSYIIRSFLYKIFPEFKNVRLR